MKKVIGLTCIVFIIVSLVLTIPQKLLWIEDTKQYTDKYYVDLNPQEARAKQLKPSWELTNELISYILLHIALIGIVLMVLVKSHE